jgi:hypothetical protein
MVASTRALLAKAVNIPISSGAAAAPKETHSFSKQANWVLRQYSQGHIAFVYLRWVVHETDWLQTLPCRLCVRAFCRAGYGMCVRLGLFTWEQMPQAERPGDRDMYWRPISRQQVRPEALH